MTTMKQRNWRKRQPEIENCLPMCYSKSSKNHVSRNKGRESWMLW
jgi:hypothetical protein